MKRTKRGMALILAAVMAVSCLTTILLAASKPWTEIDLGSLSQYYETGTNADPGRISNVDGDSGGTSYGLYMFVEKTVTSFMDWLMSSSSRSLTLSGMLSGSEEPDSGVPVEMSGRRLPSMASRPVMS